MPAISLTFDDLFVSNWLAARPVFDAFNARVTFCVSHLHMATDAQINGLHTLQSDGHEIAFHTRTHPRLKPYLDEHGLDHWLTHEIDQGIAEHHTAGFPAKTFAAPFHATTPDTRAALATRFTVVRAAGPRGATVENLTDRIYDKPGPDNAVDNIGFCDVQHRAFPGWDWQARLLDTIADTGGTGVFTGHDIRRGRGGPGFYSTHRQLRRSLRMATARGLAITPLATLATSP